MSSFTKKHNTKKLMNKCIDGHHVEYLMGRPGRWKEITKEKREVVRESGRGMLWWLYCLINDRAQPKLEGKVSIKCVWRFLQMHLCHKSLHVHQCAICILNMHWCTVHMGTLAGALCSYVSMWERIKWNCGGFWWLSHDWRSGHEVKMPRDYWYPGSNRIPMSPRVS